MKLYYKVKCYCFFTVLLAMSWACASEKKAVVDLIVTNAHIYTVNDSFEIVDALAVKNGKIVAIGKATDINNKFDAKNKIDANGKFLYPGFIDAHAHFLNYGMSLQAVDLMGTKSWEEIIERLVAFSKKQVTDNPSANKEWLIGRGWDQNDWLNKAYPDKKKLDELFPDQPVMLRRVDGHAVIVNQVVLDLAGIKPNQKILGGEIETKNNILTGVLIDKAIGLVMSKMPEADESKTRLALLEAQKNCFAVGLTTVVDCGLNHRAVKVIEKMGASNDLKMRLFVMLSDEKSNYDYIFERGMIKTEKLNVRSFKLYADGALGSRGACLLKHYSDRPGHFGFLLNNITHYDSVTQIIAEHGFQACTHAIGDSANREILRIYAKNLKGKKDHRWRIEHAQIINPADFEMFGKYQIVPSVQPTHATSDMYWAGERLGEERVKGAYAFKQLLNQNGWLPLGTDFPVEDINPMLTFYAAVVRKDLKGYPEKGYQIENALTREETLRGMTIWAAKGNFEEKEKGSLEVGKFADFILLDQDLMTVPADKITGTKVLKTYVNGELVFEKK